MKLTKHLVEHNIPLYKVKKVLTREFTSLLESLAGDIPGGSQLRNEYLPQAVEERRQEIALELRGRKIGVLMDESSERFHRSAVMLSIFTTFDRAYVAAVRVLKPGTKLDAEKVVELFDEALNYINVPIESVVSFGSDNAKYMSKAARLIQEKYRSYGCIPRIACLSHSLNLVATAFCDQFPEVNALVVVFHTRIQYWCAKRGTA